MCSQADDPSQHASDDTLRAALAMLAPGGAWYGCGEEYLRARFVETLTALAASATEERKLKRERIDWSNVVVDEGDEAP